MRTYMFLLLSCALFCNLTAMDAEYSQDSTVLAQQVGDFLVQQGIALTDDDDGWDSLSNISGQSAYSADSQLAQELRQFLQSHGITPGHTKHDDAQSVSSASTRTTMSRGRLKKVLEDLLSRRLLGAQKPVRVEPNVVDDIIAGLSGATLSDDEDVAPRIARTTDDLACDKIQLKHTLTLADSPRRLAWGADGDLASTSFDVTLWNGYTGQQKKILRKQGKAFALSYSPDGLYIAAGFTEGIKKTTDGMYEASGKRSGNVYVWDERGSLKYEDRGLGLGIAGTSFSPDSQRCAVSDDMGQVYIYETESGATLKSWNIKKQPGYSGCASALTWNSAGTHLATNGDASQAGTIKIYNVESGACEREFTPHPKAQLMCLSYDSKGKYLAGGYYDGTLVILDAQTGVIVHAKKSTQILALAWSPYGEYLATSGSTQTVTIWNVATGTAVKTVDHAAYVEGLSWDRSGNWLATGAGDKTIRIWHIPSIS